MNGTVQSRIVRSICTEAWAAAVVPVAAAGRILVTVRNTRPSATGRRERVSVPDANPPG
jgi:hypothetical protein